MIHFIESYLHFYFVLEKFINARPNRNALLVVVPSRCVEASGRTVEVCFRRTTHSCVVPSWMWSAASTIKTVPTTSSSSRRIRCLSSLRRSTQRLSPCGYVDVLLPLQGFHEVMGMSSCAMHFDFVRCIPSSCTLSCHSLFFSFHALACLTSSWWYPPLPSLTCGHRSHHSFVLPSAHLNMWPSQSSFLRLALSSSQHSHLAGVQVLCVVCLDRPAFRPAFHCSLRYSFVDLIVDLDKPDTFLHSGRRICITQ